MKITTDTPTTLVVKTNHRTRRLVFGIVILLAGLLVVSFVRIRILSDAELRPQGTLFQQDEDFDVAIDEAGKDATFRFAYYVSKRSTDGVRPIIALGVLGIIGGLIITLGPSRSEIVYFDKNQQQITVKRPRSFFRTEAEQYKFADISEVRVERNRANSYTKSEDSYGVNLSISHSEGKPLTKNYINYKTVIPLSDSYRYPYDTAQVVVDRILAFLEK
ncbi:MAG: hypothetical protein AAF485_07420 [Chloroflexota bacterium]